MYGENSTVTAGGFPSKYAVTTLAARPEQKYQQKEPSPVIATTSAPSFTVRVMTTTMGGAPYTATVTFDAFGNNVDWDAEADHCAYVSDPEECRAERKEYEEYLDSIPTITSLAVRSEPSATVVTATPSEEVHYMFGPKGLNPEESASYYSKWGKYAITATMVTEVLKPKETKIDVPLQSEPVDFCLGMDCGLSA